MRLIYLALIFCVSLNAQKAESIELFDKTLSVGDKITLIQGSGEDGKYLYCFLRGGMAQFPMGAGWEGAELEVKRIDLGKNGIVKRPFVTAKTKGAKIMLDIEKAVENGEVKIK
jgi:hypothetical protein